MQYLDLEILHLIGSFEFNCEVTMNVYLFKCHIIRKFVCNKDADLHLIVM